ncbi:MAG: hypothetical protein JOZ09_11150 [Pseudonocardiales bacterium]|nr:hypothetical protein [Pseudonocardiales bacterium]
MASQPVRAGAALVPPTIRETGCVPGGRPGYGAGVACALLLRRRDGV